MVAAMTSWAQNKSIQHSFNAKVSFPLVLSYALCSLLSQPTPIMLAFFSQDYNNMLEHALCLLGTSFQQVPYLLPKSFQWTPKIILPRFALSAPIIFFFFSQPSPISYKPSPDLYQAWCQHARSTFPKHPPDVLPT